MQNILVLGILTCDISMLGVSRAPAPGSAVPVDRVTMQSGGTAANCAMDIAKLGLPVTLCGRIGSDSFGDVVEKALSAYPLLDNRVVRDPDPRCNTTTSILSIHPSGERGIYTSLGSTFRFCRADLPEDALNRADLIFISSFLGPCFSTALSPRRRRTSSWICRLGENSPVWTPATTPRRFGFPKFSPPFPIWTFSCPAITRP